MVVEIRIMQESRDALDVQARRVRLDEEQRLLAFCHGEDDVDARFAFTRHEPLLAVQHPLVSVAVGGRLEPAEIRPCSRLGQCPGLAMLPPDDRHDVTLDLFRRHHLEKLARPAVDDREAEAVRGLAGLLLERHLGEHRQVLTAQLDRHVQLREAGRPSLRAQGIDLGRVDRPAGSDVRLDAVDLILDEAPDAGLEIGDLGGELGNDHGTTLQKRMAATARPCAQSTRPSTGTCSSIVCATLRPSGKNPAGPKAIDGSASQARERRAVVPGVEP